MHSDFQKAVQNQLHSAGLRKLPPIVIARLVEAVAADMGSALAKSVARRTAPKAVARAFAECVCSGQGLQGRQPLDQSPYGHPQDVTERQIGTHSQTDGDNKKQEDNQ